MQENKKVFSSDIKRGHKPPQNDLYDLINVVPARPIQTTDNDYTGCGFVPKTDKLYIPKKRTRFSKVKTVRDIRKLFETDICTDLSIELEKQQNLLLKKITGGSSREENTKSLAINMLKCGKPLSRPTWQMLMNLNPDGNVNPIQYVLWNGRCIRINGSKGGKNKFICSYDLTNFKNLPKRELFKKNFKKKELLKKSLAIKFKPGPLSKKKFMDNSYQKHNVGDTELVNLPKLGLSIRPVHGVALEPKIVNIVQNFREINGTISKKWAEFSVSVVGQINESGIVENSKGADVTFELKYKNNQQRLLMRRNMNDISANIGYAINSPSPLLERKETTEIPEIKTIVNELIDSVEISLQQDTMFIEDEPRKSTFTEEKNTNITSKEKGKKRYCELGRLDVTVIRLPDVPKDDIPKPCNNVHCSLGCVCSSLQCSYNFKQHCGRVECMFECKCDFSKYKASTAIESDCHNLIPGLMKLDNELSLNLAKEEQKFRQTVVVTGEKSILLKSERRNWKATKRYGDFYSNMCLKNEMKSQAVLSVVSVKLNCDNIEPWCMVHNLYKCFCKGIFTQDVNINTDNENIINETINLKVDLFFTSNAENKNKPTTRSDRSGTEHAKKRSISNSTVVTDEDSNTSIDRFQIENCARSRPYNGRKYYHTYYTSTNKRILEMESNDVFLRKKMLAILNKFDDQDSTQQNSALDQSGNDILLREENAESNDEKSSSASLENKMIQCNESSNDLLKSVANEDNIQDRSILNSVANKTKLIAWLESSYKQHKLRIDQGVIKKSLDPPKHGKVALYPWEFILGRYRERKNLFLISKLKPYRIFMAVDSKNSFFENCINIDDIRFADLHKYPVTIKNLLTNATDLKDNFCILCGLSHCWELIGSVTKVKDQVDSTVQFKNVPDDNTSAQSATHSSSKVVNQPSPKASSSKQIQVQMIPEQCSDESELNLESSKWFVMTVENDFSEIQFYQRGFFVKYESIIKAINVARMSGKTVRLSSQKCADVNSGPQFGIYAIPNANEYYVFIGPYDKEEPLGIETVKTLSNTIKLKRTRGVWITTKKVDNIKVIDNPLSFMPPIDVHPSKIVPLENEILSKEIKEKEKKSPIKSPSKTIKPIKIRKTNGFFHFAPQRIISQVASPNPHIESQNSADILTKNLPKIQKNIVPSVLPSLEQPVPRLSTSKSQKSNSPILRKCTITSNEFSSQNPKPIAEIAPQIKILGVVTEPQLTQSNTISQSRKSERGMFILKPEEINQRSLANSIKTNTETSMPKKYLGIDQDIENFLANSTVCTPPNADIFVITDEEDNNHELVKNVWIECKNNDSLGWIRGRKNTNNELSFEFPGFKFTEFYSEEEAFSKINQVLSRKIYIPKNINLDWCVVETPDELKIKQQLNAEDLGPDFVLTKRGLRHKRDLMVTSKNVRNKASGTLSPQSFSSEEVDKAIDIVSELEDQSKNLEDENDMLINQIAKNIILPSVSRNSDDRRKKIAENLQNILVTNTDYTG